MLNGLGSKEYEIVEVAPSADSHLWAFPDQRPNADKFGPIYARDDPFPCERYAGQGFLRSEEVDMERVSRMEQEER